MAEIVTTQAFSDGDIVTAVKLNNITANAAIQTDAITNRSAESNIDQANDFILMYDASATALKKVTPSNLIKAGTASDLPISGNSTIGGTLGVTGVLSALSTIELGHASDTTLSRGSAGRLRVEGVDVVTATSTDTMTNKTLNSPVISGGTINNAVIGGTTAAAGSFTSLTAASQISTQLGTDASPAISPSGDSNTGVFFPAADTIAFSEGGTESMRIDSSGNCGIGTTSPSARLHVAGTGIYNAGSGNAAGIDFAGNGNTALTNSLFVGQVTSGLSAIIERGANPLTFQTNSIERLRITPTGAISIGSSGTGFGTSGQVLTSAGNTNPTWTTATSENTASAIVQRDSSGNFSAGTITASLNGNVSGSSGSCSGNAATATTLQTARTINGISFNGSANIITNPSSGSYSNGFGARTVTTSTSTPTGGSDGDIVFVI